MKKESFFKKTALLLLSLSSILSILVMAGCPAAPVEEPGPAPQATVTNYITNTTTNTTTNNITNTYTITNLINTVITNIVTNVITNTITNIVTNVSVLPIDGSILSATISGHYLDLTLSLSGAVDRVEVSLDGQHIATLSNDYTNVLVDTSAYSAIYWDLSVQAFNDYTNSQPDTRLMNGTYIVKEAGTAPTIDGNGSDTCWATAAWAPLDQVWVLFNSSAPSAADFWGRSRFVWKGNVLYVLTEIVDDVVNDAHPIWDNEYWEDDCLEIFIDEDYSGGDHELNENAYAYHCSTLGNAAVDINSGGTVNYYGSHVTYSRQVSNGTNIWEFAVTVYNSSLSPVGTMSAGKEMGLTMAYCDNDNGAGNGGNTYNREAFIGMNIIEQADKNVTYKNADFFGHVVLQ